MDEACCHRSVFSQSRPVAIGLRNTTRALSRLGTWERSRSNSPRLARVQGQRGCANMTRVGREELDRLLSQVPNRLSARVVFLKPIGTGLDWEKTDLWQ